MSLALRVARVFDLLNRSRVQQEFEERVVADAPARIDRLVSELIDWLVEQDRRQWQALSAKLATRRHEHGERILGDETGSFHADRTRLLESVGREAQRVVDSYDRHCESKAIGRLWRASLVPLPQILPASLQPACSPPWACW
jgi:hypothetical protein